MIDTLGPLIAWALLAVSLVSVALFAFACASQRADDASDQALDLLEGDCRTADVLKTNFHARGDTDA